MNAKHQLVVYEEALKRMRSDCVEDGKAMMQKKALDGTLVPLGLWFRPSQKGVYGELKLVPRGELVPCGFIDSGASIDISVPYRNYFPWVAERSQKLPILAF